MDALTTPATCLRASPSRGLKGITAVPGDKSMSHRALILAALAEGTSRIEGLLDSDDVRRTVAAIQALGCGVACKSGTWSVTGGPWETPDRIIDCGNSGTAARLLMGAIAGRDVIATLSGDASLRTRPMGRVIDPLLAMGAHIDRQYYLPVTIRGGGLKGIRYQTPVPSAQVKSAILLAGLGTSEPVEVEERQATRDHTERMLEEFGCDIDVERRGSGCRVGLGPNRTLNACDLIIPGDPSSAAFAIGAALISKDSAVSLTGILHHPARNGLIETLVDMGADIGIANRRSVGAADAIDLHVKSSTLRGVRVPASRAPSMIDECPLLAVVAAFAAGETLMEGLAELRHKESDRLTATLEGLHRCGVEARIEGDNLRVIGSSNPPKGGAFVETHGDHRIAMAFLVLGLGAANPVVIDQTDMIATSFPDFAGFMRRLGADIQPCAAPAVEP